MALARIVSASQAADYYYEDDPITSPEGSGENSEWQGNLKDIFDINGDVKAKEFKALLAGIDVKSDKVLVQTGVNKERRAGIDLAFSAPKSLSIVALHLGDERVIDAHNKAVTSALDYIEKNLIEYRDVINIYEDGVKRKEFVHIQSGNMITAKFLHSTSRSNDPQLHTHSVILNITKTKEDKYKAISNELLFKNQKLINSIYQNELALNIQNLGYKIDNYDNKFEIAGVSDEVINNFSKRSKEIDDVEDKLRNKYKELSDAEIRDIAVLSSRDKKNHNITADELKKRWESEISKDLITPIKENDITLLDNETVLNNAITEITTTESSFTTNQLLNILINQNKGKHTLDEFKTIIDNAIKDNQIIYLGEKKEVQHYSTNEMIDIENKIVAYSNKGVNSIEPLLTDKEAHEIEFSERLTSGQTKLINHILTSKDKLNIIQGDAGTGKTYAIKCLHEIIEDKKFDTSIVGLGFTGKAAQELSEAAGIETSTIASFLQSDKQINNVIIVVDEASMVSSRDMLSLINKAELSENNRIVFIGDGKQLQAISAGKMFKDLQRDGGIHTIKMNEILRQKTDETKEIVRSLKYYSDTEDNDVLKTLIDTLQKNKNIVKVTSKSKDKDTTRLFLRQEAIEEYLKDNDSLILTTNRKEKDALNNLIRNKILDKDSIGNSIKYNVRDSINGNQFIASTYKKDDIIIYNKKEYTVKDINIDKNIINIISKSNEVKSINPLNNNNFIAYRESNKSFAKGDKIIFTRNDKSMGVQNGLSGVIENINEKNISVKVNDKKKVIFNLDNYSYIDYAYVQTIYKSQGQTCSKSILIHTEDDSISTESLYVAATRATNDIKIFTTDIDKLSNTIKSKQSKSSTRDFKLSSNLIK